MTIANKKYINKKMKDWSIKKKITVVSGVAFVLCVFCGAIANSISETPKTADYYLERMSECAPAFGVLNDYTPERWTNDLKKLGEKKFFSCVGAMAAFVGCAKTTMERVNIDNPLRKVYCACVAFQHDYFNSLSGEGAYYDLLQQNGIKVDMKKVNKIAEQYAKEQAKTNFIDGYRKCSKYENQ